MRAGSDPGLFFWRPLHVKKNTFAMSLITGTGHRDLPENKRKNSDAGYARFFEGGRFFCWKIETIEGYGIIETWLLAVEGIVILVPLAALVCWIRVHAKRRKGDRLDGETP